MLGLFLLRVDMFEVLLETSIVFALDDAWDLRLNLYVRFLFDGLFLFFRLLLFFVLLYLIDSLLLLHNEDDIFFGELLDLEKGSECLYPHIVVHLVVGLESILFLVCVYF